MDIRDFQKYLDDANKENAAGTERGIVLVWGATLDDLVLRILHAFFVPCEATVKLTKPEGALGTSAARARLCIALGLIDETDEKILKVIREIRNAFAHQIGITLSEPKIRDKVQATYRLVFGPRKDFEGQPTEMQLRFSAIASTMAMNLWNRIAVADERQCEALTDNRSTLDRAFGMPDTSN